MGREVKSKILDGINDLVIMAPIREGFINAYEPVTYATRLRIICEALNDIRAAAREYEKDVPFADASERILSLLDFKAGIIDNDLLQLQPGMGLSARRYFYLIATFDGVWEPYMRLIWNPLGSLLDLLFANCDGYVFACDNSFEDYINWVRSAQVDSAVFFTTTGVTVSDQLYLRNLEKLQRETEPAAGDLAITRMAVRNPGDVAREWRDASLGNGFAAHRLALEALGVFYRLADYYPPLPTEVLDHIGDVARADGYLLQRAMHRILDGWQHESLQPLLADGGILARFRPLVEWFASGPIHPDFASQQRPVAEPVLDHSQIQRGILSEPKLPESRLYHGAIMLMTIGNHDQAARFLAALLETGQISFEQPDQEPVDGIYRTIGLTRSGLERLAVKASTIDAFPKEFREGLYERAPHLGDVWDNHPRNWRLPERNWPPLKEGEAARAPVEPSEIDLAIVLRQMAGADDGGAAVSAEIARIADLSGQFDIQTIAVEAMNNHYDEEGRYRDHFGLRDNLSQPRPRSDAETDLTKRIGSKRDDVSLGEVLCGYSTDRGDMAPASQEETFRTSENERLDWAKADRAQARKLQLNGSYLVIRKMSQDVAAFERFLDTNQHQLGQDRKALTAKLLGRHPDGPSLIDPAASDYNDFDYVNDAAGSKCPFASHIRRANPRQIEHGRPSPRILRCGMSYGPRFQPDAAGTDNRPRGLMFMAYNSSIAEQYETIQRWINGGNSTGVASANNDPLAGTPPRPDGKRTYRFEVDGRVIRTEIEQPFVRLEWGAYLFVPSRSALEELASTGRNYYQIEEPYENAGLKLIERLEQLPEDLAAAEWKRITEDFDSKDLTQRDLTPDIYSAIRYWRGGAVRVPGGIDKDYGESPSGDSQTKRQPAVIVGSRKKIMQVLSDTDHFSVEEGLARLVRTSGSIYVAQQPDDQYTDNSLKNRWNYWHESTDTNAIIDKHGYDVGFGHGYQAGKAVLDWLKHDAETRHMALGAPGKPEFKLELRREYLAPALALCNREWFGLPDGGFKEDKGDYRPARFMEPGDWSWQSAKDRLPTCPGDCLSPSRHAFYPRSNKVSEALALDHGAAIRKAGKQFAEYYLEGAGKGQDVPGLISREMFALPGMTVDLAARNVIGIMLGATPPTLGNLQGIFYDWLAEQTLWRHQTALNQASGGKPASYDQARNALLEPLSVSMCKRPSPELLFRTCKGTKDGGAVFLDRKKPKFVNDPLPETDQLGIERGDVVYLPLASATQWAVTQAAKKPEALEEGVNTVFGGKRGVPGVDEYPVHACPGRKLAMGAMLGIVSAFLQAGRIQAQPAGLIVRISDWA